MMKGPDTELPASLIDRPERSAEKTNYSQMPSISLPKGGGAIQGIGEKFTTNPVNGTASLTVPIATSPGRGGVGPQLSLSYDSGAGNGTFGFGCSVPTGAIRRSTDRKRPTYLDAAEADVFILSGSEDLVPVTRPDGTRYADAATMPDYTICRYRPRVDGLFARIERWTRKSDGDVHWRSLTTDNVLTLYGRDAESRINDPADPARIFSWLISESQDDKGNAIHYRYKEEDGAGVDLNKTCERNRGGPQDLRRKANRYIKRILYGNRRPLLDAAGKRPYFLSELPASQLRDAGWMFEVVFDYGEHDPDTPTPQEARSCVYRCDPFSTYLPGFEVRTSLLCQRVLMFHHIPDGYDGLVHATEFSYSKPQDPTKVDGPVYSFLESVTHRGYSKRTDSSYISRPLPPLSFEYSRAVIQDKMEEIDPASLEDLPVGVDETSCSFLDLHGEGIQGIFHSSSWSYKRNLSPLTDSKVKFAAFEQIDNRPNVSLEDGQARLMDLTGNGQLDVVVRDGVYAHDAKEGWHPFRRFTSHLTREMGDPNLRMIDLDGDGKPDLLITEGDEFVVHVSLGYDGYEAARRIATLMGEEKAPRVVFADGTQSIHILNMSGDGPALARVRCCEVCYWPYLGDGRFGAKVTMDNSPCFDTPDLFDPRRLHFWDIDWTGTVDCVYAGADAVYVWFNQSGNAWSPPRKLSAFPRVDNASTLAVTDLLGNGTACLVWSSPSQEHSRRPMRYVDLMGGQKPHLLIKIDNGQGVETTKAYASSTKFYLQDKLNGRPCITWSPFPVHVVEREETFDKLSGNRFITEHSYHDAFYDHVELEWRGFAHHKMLSYVNARIAPGQTKGPPATNQGLASDLPPVLTKTWSHTGIYLGRTQVSDIFATMLHGVDKGEYFRESGLSPEQSVARLLPDTLLPDGLTIDEEREATRALKGSMLRQEIYALDGTDREKFPYSVVEQNFRVRLEQRRGPKNRHAVFFVHPHETITYHYERDPADPRIQHSLVLEVDRFGHVLKEAKIGYGRRQADMSLPLQVDRAKQTTTLVTYIESSVTNEIDDISKWSHDYRGSLPCEARTYELTGYSPSGDGGRFAAVDFVEEVAQQLSLSFDSEVDYWKRPTSGKQCRLIELVRTLYRKDDLTALIVLGHLEPRALAGETYKLAFKALHVEQIFRRNGKPLIGNQTSIFGPPARDQADKRGNDKGGYVSGQQLKVDGLFPDGDADLDWWLPSGRVYLSPGSADTAVNEFAYAKDHFFLPLRSRDPFYTDAARTESFVTYDNHDLLITATRDAAGNRTTVGERDAADKVLSNGNDYRVLQPRVVTDANRNRAAVAFDALGFLVGTAVMGKRENTEGDSLDGFVADLDDPTIASHLADPLTDPQAILGRATTRLVYDLFAYKRTRNDSEPQPAAIYALVRETHDADLVQGQRTRVQHSFAYSDGFGRVILKKVQAEPGKVPQRDANGKIEIGTDGQPLMTADDKDLRTVGSGNIEYNGRGLPWRQWEPFFSDTFKYESDVKIGVSTTIFYDPIGRVVGKLYPNHTYDKVLFDPWRQVTWDVNDTIVAPGNPADPAFNPADDTDLGPFFQRLPGSDYLPTWHDLRTDAAKALQKWPDIDAQGTALPANGRRRAMEKDAAKKASAHAGTPTTVYLDTLGRPFLTVADNGPDPANLGKHLLFAARVELDIEDNQREVRDAIVQAGDARGRIVMRYDYDMLGMRIHQESMEAGERWMLADVSGKPIRAWDSRGHIVRSDYDRLRRPTRVYVTGADPDRPNAELLTECLLYGEQHPDSASLNLRGAVHLHLDQAGLAVTAVLDFKGNLRSSSRRLSKTYKKSIDWAAANATLPADSEQPLEAARLEAVLAPMLEVAIFESSAEYDALNRMVAQTMPHTQGMKPSIIRPGYNAANLLERLDANLCGATSNGALTWTPFATNVDYDAKGRRSRLVYGKGVQTAYEYDPLTFRLLHLHTQRDRAAFPEDDPTPAVAGWAGVDLQNLDFVYDPIGNKTFATDNAQQSIFFRNRRVEPSNEYTYDAIYRLVEATGREHLGQAGGSPIPHSYNDAPRVGIDSGGPGGRFSPYDGNAMGPYTERYSYDAVGNFKEMNHRSRDPAQAGWTRTYAYNDASLIEDGTVAGPRKTSNRLSNTSVGNNNPLVEPYAYDAHGNMLRMPQLQVMQWDCKDQLRMTQRQRINDRDLDGVERHGERTWYVYDAGGQRIRKVSEQADGSKKDERIYLGGLEIFRKHSGPDAGLVRETLHIMDDRQRIALVETRNDVSDGTPRQVIRYQISNALGSTNLELDDTTRITSYQEFTAWGSTTCQLLRGKTEAPKRFGFTGKERDEQSGLHYHGARYYATWIGRWISCDPGDLLDGSNVYTFAKLNPVMFVDSTGFAAAEYWLGKSQEDASKKHQTAANELAREVSPEKQPVDVKYQEGVDQKRQVIPDEQRITRNSEKPTLVTEQKARHVDSKRNQIPATREADILQNLEQTKEQVRALEASGEAGSELKGKAVRVLHDSDRGKSSKKALATWKDEAMKVRDKWVKGAKGWVEEALRKRVNVVVTTREQYSKATRALERALEKLKPSAETVNRAAKAGEKLAKAGRHLVKPVVGVFALVAFIGTAQAATNSITSAASGDLRTAGIEGATVAADIAESTPTPVGALIGVGRAGWSGGEAVNEFLSDETRDAIGGTINEIVEHGWENMKSFYF